MASLRVTAFANTFLVPNTGRGRPGLKIVGPQDARKKRPHRCDEGDPCRNCVKRKEACVRPSPPSPNRRGERESPPLTSPLLTSPPPEEAWCPLSEPECGAMNLLHMELLHHFEQESILTLPFQEVWPRMLQLAFQSRQHTYLVNAMLSFAAAHLDYLHPGNTQYHRAKHALLNKALHGFRETLSAPITADNCDALLGTANLIQFLMWCDLSFMEPQVLSSSSSSSSSSSGRLDLSADRLYLLSTGVRQIFFMAWPLFQSAHSVFTRVGLLQPCMALEDVVDARGLNWQRHVRAFMDLYDNPRYRGGREAFASIPPTATPPSPYYLSPTTASESSQSPQPCWASDTRSSSSSSSSSNSSSAAYLEGLLPSPPPPPSSSYTGPPPYKVMTLWQSYKEGEAYVQHAGAHDEARVRAAFRRLSARLAVAMAFVSDEEEAAAGRSGRRRPEVKRSDMVRYVSTFPMLCFGPLLTLISSGDSRMLVVLFHVYRVVGCRKRVEVMQEAIGSELRSRGLEVCLRRRSEVE
ncbi:hypothetical protein C8A00DRAFT_39793 [Chaetomidium leptoderma]|uniref:Zn(2)-C6 fungal-type domain-containing protein n=1 Tax=Chaetomidium leptoderma TaxID=669021 RepID=A0AAN7A2I4_9PEZI|nr:hypothetical protein C8A00DRAFT_39793 [Chaetomidium leptoderma]